MENDALFIPHFPWGGSINDSISFFNQYIFTEVQLIYNVLISAVQQSDSVIYITHVHRIYIIYSFSYAFSWWLVTGY